MGHRPWRLTHAVNAYLSTALKAAGPGAIRFFYDAGHGTSDGNTDYPIPTASHRDHAQIEDRGRNVTSFCHILNDARRTRISDKSRGDVRIPLVTSIA